MDVVKLRKLTERSTLNFGKFKGMKIGDLIKFNRLAYIRWIYYNIEGLSFIDDILLLGEEEGERIDTQLHYAPTVYITDSINQKNLLIILQSIGFSGIAISNLFKFNK